MSGIPNRTFQAIPAWIASEFSRRDVVLLSFVLALAIISFWPDPKVADHVHADTNDYAIPALNFLHGQGFFVFANGHKYPPAHTFGLSALLSAVYPILGAEVGNGGYLVFLFGLASVVMTYYMAKTLFDRRVAVVACVLLVLASQYRFYAKVIAPDGAVSVFFCLASQILLFAALRNPQSLLSVWTILGQAMGFSLTLRPDNVLLFLPVAVLLALRIREQNRALVKVAILAGGILFWAIIILLANFLYTGDWFRNGFAVNYSVQHDRLGGMVSWRYFFIPSFWQSNFVQLLLGASSQWSLFGAESDPVKRHFYHVTNVFLVLGVIGLTRASKTNTEKRDLLLWVSLWFLSFVFFLSCLFLPTDARYLQRLVPYFCLLTAIGMVTCWDLASRLREPLGSASVLALRILLLLGLGGAGCYLLSHPHVAQFARVPQSAYLQHVNEAIPEKDAMLLTDWSVTWMEYFVARDSQRTIVPLQRFDSGADWYVQWKRPPHPEWITQDCTNRDNTATVRYKRMYENGAQDVYPDTVFPNPSAIDRALHSGRSVYVVTQGGHTIADKDAIILLIFRYNLEPFENGWAPEHETSKEVTDIAKTFTIAKLSLKQSLGIRIRNAGASVVSFESENGVRYTFPGHVESSSQDDTLFKIFWDDKREQILRFTPDGYILTQTSQ